MLNTHNSQSPRLRLHRVARRSTLSWILLVVMLASLLGPTGLTPAYAVDIPALLAPANGVTITAIDDASVPGAVVSPPVSLPEFSWTAVPGTTRYRIDISPDAGFSTFREYYTPLTSFIPTNVADYRDGLWYWRVKVWEPVAGLYSPARSFTKQWASPNNIPALLAPADGATVDFFDAPTFSWSPVVGASRYRVEISTSPTFAQILSPRVTLATSYQPENRLSNGTYYWRVVPIDPGFQEPASNNIPYRMFVMAYNQVPILLSPANNSFPTFTPTFRWTAVRGAQNYHLEYATDTNFTANLVSIDTRNTTYTPQQTLPNDVDYYWRVKAISGSGQSASGYGPYWKFRKQWYIRALLLTPVNGYQHERIPTFSWAPVPGASSYVFQLDQDTDFVNVRIEEETSNPFYTPRIYDGSWNIMYWRVIPKDGSGYLGKESLVSSYRSYYTATVPVLIYPYYYYLPNTFPPPFSAVKMNPAADRTVAYPVFYWHRLTNPPPAGGTFPYKYRLQVSTSPLFNNIVWTVDTENTHAAPTAANPFVPVAGQDYYWRVRPLDAGGNEVKDWSQVWRTRISLPSLAGLPLPPPQLRRPLNGAEVVDTTPLLEWYPAAGADSYSVQICRDAACSAVADSSVVVYPFYSPTASLAQRVPLNRVAFGTYFWRVRARSGSNFLGDWSPVSRFQIAAQSERLAARTLGNVGNRLPIGSDPSDTADSNFELTTLTAAQSSNFWYFGFNATATAADMRYGLYLDVDHLDNSGGASDPRGYTVSAIPAHRPEYVLYINQVGGAFSAAQVEVYRWNGLDWDPPQSLSSVGGSLFWDGSFVELQIPNTIIGMQDDTGSYAAALFSVPNTAPATPVDSVPSNPDVPGGGLLSRFASVSERMNPILPPNTDPSDPAATPFVFPFVYDEPVGYNGTAPWAGARLRVYRDPLFTTQVAEYKVDSNTPYYSMESHHWPDDFLGDNTYYWRVQPRYLLGGNEVFGVWSQGFRFERQGFTPQNLTESVTFATPTFSWDMVEGAREYELQVDNDSTFNGPEISIRTAQNSYTPNGTLLPGAYYWRVRVLRYNGATSDWSQTKTFTLTLPVPTGLSPDNPNPAQAVSKAPTFCWTPLIAAPQGGDPVLAASSYLLQVSRGDPNFSQIYESVITQQSCWTPTRGYDDGTYYWRVAMYDGDNHLGGFSATAVFTKQYPIARPKSPVNGSLIGGTPTFTWTAADGVTPYVFGAARYRVQVSLSPTFSQIYEEIDTNNTRYTPTRLYESQKTLYWRVAIIDYDGKVGPYSGATVIIDPYPNRVYLPVVLK